MIAKLQALLTLQELDSLLDQLSEPAAGEEERTVGSTAKATKKLRSKRQRLVREVGSELLGRYEELRRRYRRAVAPVRGGVCLGCNTRRPTKSASRAGRVDTCERCGRILFPVQEPIAMPAAPTRRGKPRKQASGGKGSTA
jgi:predicted  nucleic acid-binding Zn-ribbon protein